jgi:hypothetical protein
LEKFVTPGPLFFDTAHKINVLDVIEIEHDGRERLPGQQKRAHGGKSVNENDVGLEPKAVFESLHLLGLTCLSVTRLSEETPGAREIIIPFREASVAGIAFTKVKANLGIPIPR